jgi:chemotaxis protein methyltransferase CheR
MAAVADSAPITHEEYRRLCDFLYRRTGMIFNESRRYFVDRRVADRMEITGATSFASYFARLRTDLDGEVEQFINAFTVNESYFYREDHQLQCLTSNLLVERLRQKPAGETVRIWSMPCSTGEEPYSIAMWLLENWPQVDSHNVEIVGSDIDTAVLAAAREGVFNKRALMRLTPSLIEKYFAPAGPDRWQILDELRESVSFTAANVIDRAETLPHGLFDVIFCRNVLIYFDDG